MQPIAQYLEKIVSNYIRRMEAISDAAYLVKPSPDKWSKKEILGHLVDSAQNNIRRFIVAQYEDTPATRYSQDDWVAKTGYSDYPTRVRVALWTLLNKHIVIILTHMSPEAAQRKCTRGGQPQTLEWVAADYCN